MRRWQGARNRAARVAALTAGVVASVATSSQGGGGWWAEVEGSLILHNGTSAEIVVRVRPLRLDVGLDCEAVASDPGRLLTDTLFDQTVHWRLPPTTNAALVEWAGHGCFAALVETDENPSAVVFWDSESFRSAWFQGSSREPPTSFGGAAGVIVTDEGLHAPEAELVFERRPAGEGTCPPQPGAERVDWTTPPEGPVVLASVDAGLDGCLAIDVRGATERFYLCLPERVFPWAPGDRVTFEEAGSGIDVWLEGYDDRGVRLLVGRGVDPLGFAGLSVGTASDQECLPSVGGPCGTVVRPVSVELLTPRGPMALDAGARLAVPLDDGTATVTLVHHEERLVVDGRCADGPFVTGPDIELVAVIR